MRFANKSMLSLLIVGLLAAAWGFATQDKQEIPADSGLLVHEWGTFSTFAGSDGTNLEFQPYDNDLPDFVHGYLPKRSKEGPKGGTISLETPVLYFYSERALTASVEVDFPKGILTEWYPCANRTDKKLVWRGLEVLPRGDAKWPIEMKPSRYYPARETDSNPLRALANEAAGAELEKFLFYRGVGTFGMPLTARAARDGVVTVNWNGKAPDGELMLVRIEEDKIRFQPFRLEQVREDLAKAYVRVPSGDASSEELGEVLVRLLQGKGLFEKEARAMVKTWSSAWFAESGTRILYLLPEKLTEELLPLRLNPKPSSLIRVLVGRHDILTPEREKQIDGWVAEVMRGGQVTDARQRIALIELEKLGRYRGAAWNASEARLKRGR